MTAEVEHWRAALVAEHAKALELLALIETQQAHIIGRQFSQLTDNLAQQAWAISEVFTAERLRQDSQRRLATTLGIGSPGRRGDIYPRRGPEVARDIEATVVQLQNLMSTNQRKFKQNVMLLGRSIELAQQVMLRAGVNNTGRTYGAKGRERSLAFSGNTLSRWSSVI
ncbi:MAG: flagellar export chaperone FlgN [Verrucomicrobiota bacterium]